MFSIRLSEAKENRICFPAIIFQLFKIITLENCVLTILELNWNQRLGHKKTKLNILLSYAHVVHTTSKLVILRRRKNENVLKKAKNKTCSCKACKNTIFHCQICKFVGFLLPSSSWLLKFPNVSNDLLGFSKTRWSINKCNTY